MVQSLIAIATFMAVISGVIFGVARFEKSTKQEDEIELITQPTVSEPSPPEPPKPVVSESVEPESVVSEAPEESIPEPSVPEVTESEPELTVAEESVNELISEPVAPAIDVDTQIEPRDEVEDIILPPVIQDPARQELLEPRAAIAEIIIPPTIQDPKRPNDGKLEDLTQEILAWGQSKDLKHLAKLMQYATHSDAIVRSHVATSLGRIVSAHPMRGDVERSIPVLGKLTNDSDVKVRVYAVQSLGTIRSQEVLPYLEQALRSPSGSVTKAANRALQNLKLQYGKPPSVQVAQQMLEKVKKPSRV
ncbi:HEAT repeat domain-containing protein [Leptolyngbya boryana CZ1]|uniref:HEAT repeat domain-containing protein n=1 Tax=Leptolyngbya boryana CZ1 TaxID=3060204 RepID=A0AA96X4N3_LEPBY|nr:HEAT repeat domain-containing protein [Leptolyngbya boryana]WNZ45485.1 HEAT repeat domain-containing protein [Leptolyngbya boryana CZ1]